MKEEGGSEGRGGGWKTEGAAALTGRLQVAGQLHLLLYSFVSWLLSETEERGGGEQPSSPSLSLSLLPFERQLIKLAGWATDRQRPSDRLARHTWPQRQSVHLRARFYNGHSGGLRASEREDT